MTPEDAALYAALYAERNLQPPRRELTRAQRPPAARTDTTPRPESERMTTESAPARPREEVPLPWSGSK